MRKHFSIALMVSSLVLAAASPANAQMGADRRGNSLTHQRQNDTAAPAERGMSGADAARIAGQRTGGRVLEVSPRGRGYNVKVYVQGKVRTVYVD